MDESKIGLSSLSVAGGAGCSEHVASDHPADITRRGASLERVRNDKRGTLAS